MIFFWSMPFTLTRGIDYYWVRLFLDSLKKENMKLLSLYVLAMSLLVSTACSSNDPDDNGGDGNKEKYVEVSYTESDKVIINPERGFYTHKEFSTKGDDDGILTASLVKEYRTKDISLFLTIYYMPDFRDKAISSDFLQRIRSNMDALRAGGAKSVLRFAYTSSEADKPWDAPWNVTQQHIEQLKPILKEYADVICVLEAGFVGVWGEWYYTDNYGFAPTEKVDYAPRRQVLDALLDALPEERMIGVRTPAAKMGAFDLSLKDTITVGKAYNGTSISRIAGHNDCFLADADDSGTYNGNNRDHRRFWQYDTRYTAMGGETCKPSTYAECSKALLELEKFHWSYINIDYHSAVINDWIVNGCIDEIKKRLGYRFVMTKGKFSNGGEKGNPFEINLELKNAGWAAPFNPRNVEVIFVSKNDENEKYKLQLKDDPRFWFAGESIMVSVNVGLPESMSTGDYDIFLNLPDPKSSISDRAEYSIQLANDNVWDSDRGYNKIHTTKIATPSSKENFTGEFLDKF